jgi:hypothetical protein
VVRVQADGTGSVRLYPDPESIILEAVLSLILALATVLAAFNLERAKYAQTTLVTGSAGSASSALTVVTAQVGASRVALATVVDARDRAIVDLGADDFVVQEGTDVREILSVRPADYPIVVMIDTGVSARADLPHMQRAVARFIERIGQQRPVAIGTFADPPRMLTAFDDDRGEVLTKLHALEPATSPSTVVSGVAVAADALRPFGSLFSAIIVISGGAVDDDRTRADALVEPIVTSGAILYMVTNRGPSTSLSASPQASTPAATSAPAASIVRNLAEQTHGQYTTIYTAASYEAALDRFADRLTTELMVEYLVPPQSKAMEVKVGVRRPGARVRGLGVAPR